MGYVPVWQLARTELALGQWFSQDPKIAWTQLFAQAMPLQHNLCELWATAKTDKYVLSRTTCIIRTQNAVGLLTLVDDSATRSAILSKAAVTATVATLNSVCPCSLWRELPGQGAG